MEHPEILYIPQNLPGSTPKKANLIPCQAREEIPELKDMNHQELVDLVKELLQERANRPPPTTTNKDSPLAGHVTMNQDLFVQSSKAILQGLAEGGYIHTKTPKFECFFHNLYHNLFKTVLILCHRLLKTKTLLTLEVVEMAEVGLEAEVVEVEVEVQEV